MRGEAVTVNLSMPDPGPGSIDQSMQSVVSLSGASDFTEIFGIDVPPAARRGQVVVSGTVIDSSGLGTTYQHATIEVQIAGVLGGCKNILRRGVIGGSTGPVVHVTTEGQAFQRLLVEARAVVDGAGISSVAPLKIEVFAQSRLFLK